MDLRWYLNTFLDLKHAAIKNLLSFYSFILLNGYREAAGEDNLKTHPDCVI